MAVPVMAHIGRRIAAVDALNDLGLGGVIVTHDEGYSLPEPGRSAVLNRLISEASV